MLKNYFKTKKRLQVMIDNYDKIEGVEDYLNNHFHSKKEEVLSNEKNG